jgi:hypothetical protein
VRHSFQSASWILDLEATCSSKKSNNGAKVVPHDLFQIGNASATRMNPCGGRKTIDGSAQGHHTIRQYIVFIGAMASKQLAIDGWSRLPLTDPPPQAAQNISLPAAWSAKASA